MLAIPSRVRVDRSENVETRRMLINYKQSQLHLLLYGHDLREIFRASSSDSIWSLWSGSYRGSARYLDNFTLSRTIRQESMAHLRSHLSDTFPCSRDGSRTISWSTDGGCRRGDDIWLLHCSWGDLGSHTGIIPQLMSMIRGRILVLTYLDSHSTPQKSCHFGIVNLDTLSPAQAIGLVNLSPSLRDQLLTPTAVDMAGRHGSGS